MLLIIIYLHNLQITSPQVIYLLVSFRTISYHFQIFNTFLLNIHLIILKSNNAFNINIIFLKLYIRKRYILLLDISVLHIYLINMNDIKIIKVGIKVNF